MADFPTLGLLFDLTSLEAGIRKLGAGEQAFVDVGEAAVEAEKRVRREAAAEQDAGVKAESAGKKRRSASSAAAQEAKRQAAAAREVNQTLIAYNAILAALNSQERARSKMAGLNAKVEAAAERGAAKAASAAAREAAEAKKAAKALEREAIKATRDAQIAADKASAESARQEAAARREAKAAQAAQAKAAAAAERAALKEVNDARRAAERLTRETKAAETAAVRAAAKAEKDAAREVAAAVRAQKQEELRLAREAAAAVRAGRAEELHAARMAAAARAGTGGGGGRAPPSAPTGGGGGGGGGFLASAAAAMGLNNTMRTLASTTQSAGGIFGGFFNMIGRLRVGLLNLRFAAALFLGVLTVGPIVQMADALQSLNARIGIYASSAAAVPYTFEALYNAAQKARQPLEGMAVLYTRLAPMAQQLGKSQMDMVRITETVAKSFAIAGTSAAEAASSAQQLAQALASNRLGGDELRSLAENAPVLLNEVAKSLGMNTGQFIKWAQSGKANAAVVIGAIEQAAGRIDEVFNNMPVTVGQAITVTTNSFAHLVDEVNRTTGATTALAGVIMNVSEFLSDQSTVNALVSAVNALGTAFTIAGQVIGVVVDILPGLLVATAVAVAFRLLSVALVATNVAMASNITRTATLVLTMRGLGAAATAVGGRLMAMTAIFGGPWGIAIMAAGAAIGYLTAQHMDLQQVFNTVDAAHQSTVNALQRALAFSEAYGRSTESLRGKIADLAGVELSQIDHLDKAGQQAVIRANQERILTKALLVRAAAEATAGAASLRRSAFAADVSSGLTKLDLIGVRKGSPRERYLQEQLAKSREQSGLAKSSAADLDKLGGTLRGELASGAFDKPILDVPKDNTRGTAQPGATKDAGKKGRGDGQTQNAIDSMLKDIEKARAAETAIRAEMAAARDLAAQRSAYYASGIRDSAAYSEILSNERDAVLAARIAEQDRQIAAQYGEALREDSTGAVKEHIAALQQASAAELTAADAQERLNAALAASKEVEANVADMIDYAAALDKGAEALIAYNRAKRSKELQEAGLSGPAADMGAAMEDQAAAVVAIKEREKARRDELKYAALTADEAARAAEADRRAAEYLRAGKAATIELAESMARAEVEAEKLVDQINKLKRDMKEAFEQAFVDTGKFDLKGLRDQVTRALRKSLYDAFLKGPVNMVIDAVVNVTTKGIEDIIAQFKAAMAGKEASGIGGQAGSIAKKVMDKMGLSKETMAKITKIGGAAIAGYGMGTAASDMIGAKGSGLHPGMQKGMDMAASAIGAYFGGPIGSAAAVVFSRLIGSAVLGKASNQAAVVSLDSKGDVTSTAGKRRTDETTKAANDVAAAVKVGQDSLRQLGGAIGATVQSIDIGTRDATTTILSNGQVIKSAVGDAAAAAQDAMRAVVLNTTFLDSTMTDLAHGMARAGKSFEEISQTLEAYKKAQEDITDVRIALLRYTNPQQAAVQTLQRSQIERRQALRANADRGFYSAGQRSDLESMLSELENHEIVDALDDFYGSTTNATKSIEDQIDAYNDLLAAQKDLVAYVDGLKSGELSPLDDMGRLQEAARQYAQARDAAAGGDPQAMADVKGFATEYLKQAQGFYASGPDYVAIFNSVYDQLKSLSTMGFANPAANDNVVGAIADMNSALAAANASLQAAIDAGFLNLNTTVQTTAEQPSTATLSQDQLQQLLDGFLSGARLTNDQLANVANSLVGATQEQTAALTAAIGNGSALNRQLNGGVIAA